MKPVDQKRIVAPNQQGIALVFALVVLVLLTILGVSAMKTSSLEIKMAVGIQDNTMAFQAAESGLVEAFRNVTLDPNQTVKTTYTPGYGISATTDTTFDAYSNMQNSDKPSSKVNYRQANFKQTATATTPGGAKVTIHQGVRQIINN
jgi:Tfp pilus assembly protein PilX